MMATSGQLLPVQDHEYMKSGGAPLPHEGDEEELDVEPQAMSSAAAQTTNAMGRLRVISILPFFGAMTLLGTLQSSGIRKTGRDRKTVGPMGRSWCRARASSHPAPGVEGHRVLWPSSTARSTGSDTHRTIEISWGDSRGLREVWRFPGTQLSLVGSDRCFHRENGRYAPLDLSSLHDEAGGGMRPELLAMSLRLDADQPRGQAGRREERTWDGQRMREVGYLTVTDVLLALGAPHADSPRRRWCGVCGSRRPSRGSS